MKAIIPVAGAGAKLRPHTYTQPKALIPIAGKTILSFIVDQLNATGIHEFIFIVGYLGEKIQEYVKQTYPDLKCHFVYQNERQGTGHAPNTVFKLLAIPCLSSVECLKLATVFTPCTKRISNEKSKFLYVKVFRISPVHLG